MLRGTRCICRYATALRMGNFGYQNTTQKKLGIQYDDLTGLFGWFAKSCKNPYLPLQARQGLHDDAHGLTNSN